MRLSICGSNPSATRAASINESDRSQLKSAILHGVSERSQREAIHRIWVHRKAPKALCEVSNRSLLGASRNRLPIGYAIENWLHAGAGSLHDPYLKAFQADPFCEWDLVVWHLLKHGPQVATTTRNILEWPV